MSCQLELVEAFWVHCLFIQLFRQVLIRAIGFILKKLFYLIDYDYNGSSFVVNTKHLQMERLLKVQRDDS